MTQQIGISGMGRIGRLLIRRIFNDNMDITLKAINCVYPIETVAHLLKYDSVHGKWDATIEYHGDQLFINNHVIQVFYEREPDKIPWDKAGVRMVIDANGKFNDRQGAGKHLLSCVSFVNISAPGKQMDLTIVMGGE